MGGASVGGEDPQGGWRLCEPYAVTVSPSGDPAQLHVSGGALVVTRSYAGSEPCYDYRAAGVVRDEQIDIDWHGAGGVSAAQAYADLCAWAQAPEGSRIAMTVGSGGVGLESVGSSEWLPEEYAPPPAVLDDIKAAVRDALAARLEQ